MQQVDLVVVVLLDWVVLVVLEQAVEQVAVAQVAVAQVLQELLTLVAVVVAVETMAVKPQVRLVVRVL
jgi:hypothetical protein